MAPTPLPQQDDDDDDGEEENDPAPEQEQQNNTLPAFTTDEYFMKKVHEKDIAMGEVQEAAPVVKALT